MVRYAGIEAGGTTWVVAIAEGDPTNIVERGEFKTTTPAETLAQVVAWLKGKQFDCLGVASFGPIELHRGAAKYGFITTTPKPGWCDIDVLGTVRRGLGLAADFPLGWDTDVNAPALAEYAQAAADGAPLGSCAYVTVGTGCGVGLVFNGEMLHGLLHGEGGHMAVPEYPKGVDFATTRRSHSLACPTWNELEVMCNSAALAKFAQCEPADLKSLPDDHEVWDLAAHYLACLCVNLILTVSPERIVLSGGVLLRQCLFPKIRALTQAYLNGYIDVPQVTTAEGIAQLIVPSKHGNGAGMVGALFLGRKALADATHKAVPVTELPATCKAAAASQPFLSFWFGVAAGLALAAVAAKARKCKSTL